MIHRLERELTVPTTLREAWDFIRRPANLDAITPPDLAFEIRSDVPDEMHDGLLVEYVVRIPLVGKQRWLTEIKHVRPPFSFVDEQRVGPYRLWYHEHLLEEVGGGVRFRDRVHYLLPLGPLGELAHALFVKRTLARIFDYRTQALRDRFGAPSAQPPRGGAREEPAAREALRQA